MSWSISLSAPIAVVARELQEAKRVLESAIAHLEGHRVEPKDTVSVNVNGHVLWTNKDGVVGSSTGHSIAVTPYREPEPATAKAEEPAPAPPLSA